MTLASELLRPTSSSHNAKAVKSSWRRATIYLHCLVYNFGAANTMVSGGLGYSQTFSDNPLHRLQPAQKKTAAQAGRRQTATIPTAIAGLILVVVTRVSTSTRAPTGSPQQDLVMTRQAISLTIVIHSYAYDAEGHIKTIDGNTAYVYDGTGARVRKLVGENIRFVYGLGGELIMEFDGANGNLTKEYVYGGGSVATIEPTALNSNGTRYSTSDNLGSPRVITNSAASVISRHDYMPFGEELGAGV